MYFGKISSKWELITRPRAYLASCFLNTDLYYIFLEKKKCFIGHELAPRQTHCVCSNQKLFVCLVTAQFSTPDKVKQLVFLVEWIHRERFLCQGIAAKVNWSKTSWTVSVSLLLSRPKNGGKWAKSPTLFSAKERNRYKVHQRWQSFQVLKDSHGQSFRSCVSLTRFQNCKCAENLLINSWSSLSNIGI